MYTNLKRIANQNNFGRKNVGGLAALTSKLARIKIIGG